LTARTPSKIRVLVIFPTSRHLHHHVRLSLGLDQSLAAAGLHRPHSTSSLRRFDTSQPFSYYEILELKRDAKQSEVKEAYFRLAKLYHPDVNSEDGARETFDKITEAYTTLIDLTQRYFYDQHGVACEELKKRGSHSTIFDWVPKYSIYEHETRADGESSELEDWFKAQGHIKDEPRISLRQRMKNAYVEFRFGLAYYDFPWEWKWFAAGLTLWAIILFIICKSLSYGFNNVSYRKPVPIYLKWENDEIYDILWYIGVRKNKSDTSKRSAPLFPVSSKGKMCIGGNMFHFIRGTLGKRPRSEVEIGGMHHMPKRENYKSEYSHTIYSNTRNRLKSKNKDRHQQRKKESLRIKKKEKSKNKKLNDGFSV